MNDKSTSFHKNSRSVTQNRLVIFIVALLILGAAFWNSFGLFRFHDDWTFVYRAYLALNGNVSDFIFRPLDQHWSPLWHTTELVNFLLVGWESDYFIRFIQIILQASALGAIYILSKRYRFGVFGTVVAMAVMGLHHSNAAAIYSFDTYSQCAADVIGWIGSISFMGFLLKAQRPALWLYANALLLLLIALLFKEQALAAAGVYGVFSVVQIYFVGKCKHSFRRLFVIMTPVVLMVLVFALVRWFMGTTMNLEGGFAFSILDAPKNMATLALALVSPVSTLEWIDAARAEPVQLKQLALYALLSGLVVAAISAGCIFRLKRKPESPERGLTMLLGAMTISFFPVSIMAHVGELYVHTSLFWFAMIVGYSIDGWQGYLKSAPKLITASYLLVVLVYIMSLTVGLRNNLSEMRKTGDRTKIWFERFDNILSDIPEGSRVLIYNHNRMRGRDDYGLYRISTVRYLVLTGMNPASLLYITGFRVSFWQVFRDRDLESEISIEWGGAPPTHDIHILGEDVSLIRRTDG